MTFGVFVPQAYVFLGFFFSLGARAGCENWIWQPVVLSGAHAARCNFTVLSKIKGDPDLRIAAES